MAVGRMSDHLFRYGGHVGLHTIVGGVDVQGPQLFQVSNDGNFFHANYVTMGSGSLAAMGIFESEYKENMDREEAVNLVIKAIEAGIYHDLGSGSNVDCAVITRNKVDYLRNIRSDNKKVFQKPGGYTFRKDKVQVINEYRIKGLVVEEKGGPQPMDLN